MFSGTRGVQKTEPDRRSWASRISTSEIGLAVVISCTFLFPRCWFPCRRSSSAPTRPRSTPGGPADSSTPCLRTRGTGGHLARSPRPAGFPSRDRRRRCHRARLPPGERTFRRSTPIHGPSRNRCSCRSHSPRFPSSKRERSARGRRRTRPRHRPTSGGVSRSNRRAPGSDPAGQTPTRDLAALADVSRPSSCSTRKPCRLPRGQTHRV